MTQAQQAALDEIEAANAALTTGNALCASLRAALATKQAELMIAHTALGPLETRVRNAYENYQRVRWDKAAE